MACAVIDGLLDLIDRLGHVPYGTAQLSEYDHAVQCADLARTAGADDALVVAALLHDIGHLVVKAAMGEAALGIDNKHEAVGAVFLAPLFPAAVTEPIRLHVAAKRYLAATDTTYRNALSPAAARSLARQGGAFTPEQCEAFEALAFHAEAVQLRRWDDLAMVPEHVPAELRDFADVMQRCLRQDTRAQLETQAT